MKQKNSTGQTPTIKTARIYPSKIGASSKEKAQVYRVFKKLSDEFMVWFSAPVAAKTKDQNLPLLPDCLILYKKRFGFIIHISDTDQKSVNQIIQKDIFDTEDSITLDQLGDDESTILESFCKKLRSQVDGDIPLKKLVIFPSVKHHSIEALRLQQTADGVNFLGIDKLKDGSLTSYLSNLAEQELPAPQLLQLRRSFTPETEVPSTFSPLSPLSPKGNKAPATVHHRLLDLDQEWCMKNNLHLSKEASAELEESTEKSKTKSQLITGTAGCGKSLILLYRALYNAQLEPDAKILILTHNRPLISELQRRAEEIGTPAKNLKYLTFFQWATSELNRINHLPDIIQLWEIKAILAKQLFEDSLTKTTNLTEEFLCEEIGWIKDHNLKKLQDYLDISRHGRGGALQANQRREVWRHFSQYQRTLAKEQKIDWHGVAIRFHHAAMNGEINFPQYDCILIDEAQFFAKTWFDVVNAAIQENGQIFLAADPTQGFLKRKQSWIASGINVRGRTKKLSTPYRNSRSILSFASQFFKERSINDDKKNFSGLNIPGQEQIKKIEILGSPPEIIYCHSKQESINYISGEIQKLHTNGLEANKILVIHPKQPNQIHDSLVAALGSDQLVHDTSNPLPTAPPFVKTCKLYAATGLEAPIVFLLGIDSILEKEGNPTLSEDALAEMKRDHTRLLYMAFTRAGQKLIIMTESKRTEEALKKLCGLLFPKPINAHANDTLIS